MFDDRRRHPRYPVLLAGDARPAGGQAFRVVCTSVSRAGAYFACSVDVPPGTELLATLHTSTTSGVELNCRVEAVRQNRRGGAESPGFGARWHSLVCKQGPDPLWQFVAEMLHWADAPPPEVDPSGLARYDVNSDGVWIGAAVPPQVPPANGIRDADTLVGGIPFAKPAALPPSALSKVLELEVLRNQTGQLSLPTTRDSAKFSAVGDFWDDDRTLAGPSPSPEDGVPAWGAPLLPLAAPQAPAALFAARRRDPSQPYEILGEEAPSATAAQDGTVTMRELPPFAPVAPKPKIMPAVSGEFPVAVVSDTDKTQP